MLHACKKMFGKKEQQINASSSVMGEKLDELKG